VRDQREPDDLLLVHTSDIHVGADLRAGEEPPSEAFRYLRAVLVAAARVDLLLVAGDLFDHNRLRLPVLEAAVALLAEASCRIVILPGNHDPLTSDSVYFRGPFAEAPNVYVLGRPSDMAVCAAGRAEEQGEGESVVFPEWDLEVLGRAHRDYADMAPLGELPPRTTRWRIVLAHGHYDDELLGGASVWRPSWRFRNEHLGGIDADYVALGHWNRAVRVGDGGVPAYYSGSPDLAGTVNLVSLGSGGVCITREQLGQLPGRATLEGNAPHI
jgi:DNA repair exonuclease SbcCD nuclease subunit